VLPARDTQRAMSQKNVEVVRELWDAYSRGDFDHVLALSDPYVVMVSLEEGALYGPDAIRKNYERWREAWEKPATVVEEVIDTGDQVVVIARFHGRGRASGVTVEQRLFEVYTLRNGKILRVDEFSERAEALDAAGLSE
jgi:ketosteroid isomerase-like protein